MADDWAVHEGCRKGGGWIQVSFILMSVHSKQLISGISEVFVVLSLNVIIGFVVDQFSCREAEYFVSVVFLLWAGIEERIVDSQLLGWYQSAQPCWFQKSGTAGLAKSFHVYGNCLVSYHKSR